MVTPPPPPLCSGVPPRDTRQPPLHTLSLPHQVPGKQKVRGFCVITGKHAVGISYRTRSVEDDVAMAIGSCATLCKYDTSRPAPGHCCTCNQGRDTRNSKPLR